MDKLSQHDQQILDTIFDPLQSLGINSDPGKILNEVANTVNDPELSQQIKDLVKRAIVLSENGELHQALELFDEARAKAPRSASVLNDRAQALRLAGRNQEALQDLTLAVECSGGEGKAGVQALCQRAALYRCLARDEDAKQDFARAAHGGSKFAKSQLVAMNPYAAMCNAMLQKIAMKTAPK
ncbi:tetratricopeptide repeat protein 36 homolog [Phymastichus coffea]|uniref:tetratricopeptide repeat protein 36 homolog n=1 Tax=Phymastichus coffea TaxID=108790 RepID=UPI00273A80C4|nr:tetratricopeptide repeat protein 36 homolog [Phymastichus coffea]